MVQYPHFRILKYPEFPNFSSEFDGLSEDFLGNVQLFLDDFLHKRMIILVSWEVLGCVRHFWYFWWSLPDLFGHTQLYQLARSELDSFDLFDSVDFICKNSCGRSAWIINELYNLTCIGLSLVDKIHSCLIIIIIIDVMGSDVLWLPERIFVDRMIFDLTSYNDSSHGW